jgi:hypothetical protein
LIKKYDAGQQKLVVDKVWLYVNPNASDTILYIESRVMTDLNPGALEKESPTTLPEVQEYTTPEVSDVFEINGTKVSLKLGDVTKEDSCAIGLPEHLDPKLRRTAGSVFRSPLGPALERMVRRIKRGDHRVGDIIVENVREEERGQTNFRYLMSLLSVNASPTTQFNIVRHGTARLINMASALPTEENNNGPVQQISLVAFGTGPQGYLKGVQSAKAIFAGINDCSPAPLQVNIVILDNKMYRPLLGMFREVALTPKIYLDIPDEGEVGRKEINGDLLADDTNIQKTLNDLHTKTTYFDKNYDAECLDL